MGEVILKIKVLFLELKVLFLELNVLFLDGALTEDKQVSTFNPQLNQQKRYDLPLEAKAHLQRCVKRPTSAKQPVTGAPKGNVQVESLVEQQSTGPNRRPRVQSAPVSRRQSTPVSRGYTSPAGSTRNKAEKRQTGIGHGLIEEERTNQRTEKMDDVITAMVNIAVLYIMCSHGSWFIGS